MEAKAAAEENAVEVKARKEDEKEASDVSNKSNKPGRAVFVNGMIIDINGAEKKAIWVKRVKSSIPDVVNEGMEVEEDYVEALIQGKKVERKWKEWYPLQQFQEANPGIKLK